MEKILHRAEKRGRGDYGWLTTRYSFSFANWYEPSRMGFGALRVLNDDTIAPASGFPPHGHRDMEILTIVTKGTLAHKDSIGNAGEIPAGDVQVMSAGSGIVHAEYNASQTEPLELFQIWIETNEKGTAPRYDQRAFGAGKCVPLVGPLGTPEDVLGIRQDAFISRVTLENETYAYALRDPRHGLYVFAVAGPLEAAGTALGTRDALGITGAAAVTLAAREAASALLIEVPLTGA